MCTVLGKSGIGGVASNEVERWIVTVSDPLTEAVRFKPTFSRRSFVSGRDLIPYLGWTVAVGMLTKLSIHVSEVRNVTLLGGAWRDFKSEL